MPKFQLKLDGEWKDYTAKEQDILRRAFMEDEAGVRFHSRGQDYYCDFARMVQRNLGSGKERELRAVHDSDVKSHSSKPCADADAVLAQALQDKLDHERFGPPAAQAAHAAQPGYVPGVAVAGAAACPPSGCAPGHGGYAAAAPPPYAPQPSASAYGAGGYAAAAPPPYAPAPQPYTSGGYAAGAPPPYAPAPQHYGSSAYGAAPASGPGMGISPMTAGLMGAGAGLLGGLLID